MTKLNAPKWQGVDLTEIHIDKAANGYTVGLYGKLPKPDPVSGDLGVCETFVFATGAEVADFARECLCGGTQDDGGGAC